MKTDGDMKTVDWPEVAALKHELAQEREQQASTDDRAYSDFLTNREAEATLLEAWGVSDLLRYLNGEILAPVGKLGRVVRSEGPSTRPAYTLEWPGITRGRPFRLRVTGGDADDGRTTLTVSSDGPDANHIIEESVDTPEALRSTLLAQMSVLVRS